MFRYFQGNEDQIAKIQLLLGDVNLTYFRAVCIVKLGNLLSCDEEIAEHEKIAIKTQTRKWFILRLQASLIIPLYVSSVVFLILLQNNLATFIAIFTLAASMILSIVSIYFSRRDKIKNSVSLLVYEIMSSIANIYCLRREHFRRSANIRQVEVVKKLHQQLGKRLEEVRKQKKNHLKEDERDVTENMVSQMQKREILSNLENAARYAEYYIPLSLKSKDAVTDDLFRNSMQRFAGALREKKIWILTPMEDTADQFVAKMISTLVHIVNDDWHSLERVEPGKITRPSLARTIITLLLKGLKVIFIASLVLLMFLVFQLVSPVPLTGTVRDYLLIAGFLWFGITVLIKVDSDIVTKFSLLKDAKALLSSQETNPKS